MATKVMSIFGTRPAAITMLPLVLEAFNKKSRLGMLRPDCVPTTCIPPIPRS